MVIQLRSNMIYIEVKAREQKRTLCHTYWVLSRDSEDDNDSTSRQISWHISTSSFGWVGVREGGPKNKWWCMCAEILQLKRVDWPLQSSD